MDILGVIFVRCVVVLTISLKMHLMRGLNHLYIYMVGIDDSQYTLVQFVWNFRENVGKWFA